MKRLSAILLGAILALSVHASGFLNILMSSAPPPALGIHYVQTIPQWGPGLTPLASTSFTASAGDFILAMGADYTSNSAQTISFSGTGSYSVLTPPGQFQDVESDSTALAANTSATAGAQTLSISTSGLADLVTGIAVEYSGAQNVTAAKNSQTNPGTGSGAVLGVSVTVPFNNVLVAIAMDLDLGGGLTATGGTTRYTAASYTITDYAGTGAAVQPAFTATAGTDHFLVVQFLLGFNVVTGTHKWNPGFFGLTGNQPLSPGGTYSGSQTQTDVNLMISTKSDGVVGYTFWVYWAGFESNTANNWTFSGCSTLTTTSRSGCATGNMLDDTLNALWAGGERAILVIQDTGAFPDGTAPPTASDNFALPAYITATANTGTYGAGQTCQSNEQGPSTNPSGAGGWWGNASGSYSANIENANVQARLIAMVQHIAAVYDQDPVLEGIIFTAMDFHYPCGSLSGLRSTPYYTAWENILSAALTAFPHTNVGIQVAFDETGDAQVENFTQWLVTNGGMVSVSDTFGHTSWSPGISSANCDAGGGAPWASGPNSTGGTLSSVWTCGTAPGTYSGGSLYYSIQLGTTNQNITSVTFTNGSTSVSWPSTSITGGSSNAFNVAHSPLNLQQGVQAWVGVSPHSSGYSVPSPALQSYSTMWPLIEAPDTCNYPGGPSIPGAPYGISDIVTALNATGINGYQASHPSFAIAYSGQGCTDTTKLWSGAGGVAATLGGLSLTNTAYPTVYPH